MGTLYILFGIPLSGKEELLKNFPRTLLSDKFLNIFIEDDVENDKEMFITNFEDTRKEDYDIIIDKNSITQDDLEFWLEIAKEIKYKPKVIVMSTPLNVIIENNNNLDEPISEDKMRDMYNNFIMTLGWLYLKHPYAVINSAQI